MRNLRNFIVKNYFFFLFLLFELAALSMLVNSNDFQRTTFINSSNSVAGVLFDIKARFTDYVHLRAENEKLLRENAYLQSLLKESHYDLQKGEIPQGGDSLREAQYVYLPAKVIHNTVHAQDNFLTLNRGSLDGIRKDMGVTNGLSIVGFVKDVSPHYSTVVSVLNKNFVLGVKLKKNNEHGLIRWEGAHNDEVLLTGITVPAEEGDTIVTRGGSARFPENILVGTAIRSENRAGSINYTITVKLATRFNALYHVYVIDNRLREEQLQLEAQIDNAQ